MNLLKKIDLLLKNKIKCDREWKIEKLKDKYLELKKIYDEVESSLKQGHINILVKGKDSKDLAKKYFSNWWVGCSGDCTTEYILEMTESGIIKLEKDYKKAKEVYENVR